MSLIKSFRDAFRGIWIAFKEQRNMKIHLLAVVVVTITGFNFKFSYLDWCLVVLASGLVIGLEIMNSSIEQLVNFVSPERRVESGRIKDMAAGAVLIAALASVVLIVFIIISKI